MLDVYEPISSIVRLMHPSPSDTPVSHHLGHEPHFQTRNCTSCPQKATNSVFLDTNHNFKPKLARRVNSKPKQTMVLYPKQSNTPGGNRGELSPENSDIRFFTKKLDSGEKYKVSTILDQNNKPFVISSDGTLNFGKITVEHGLTSAPIRLSEGDSINGLLHIESRHGNQIRKVGYDSIVSFVEMVARTFNKIKEGKNYENESSGVNESYMLQLTDEHNNTLYIQLSRDGSYWNVNSAGVFKKTYGRKNKTIWSASELQNSGSATTYALQSEPDAEEGSTSNGTAPIVSEC